MHMNKLLFLLLFPLFLLGAGCTTQSDLPDEFWGIAGWQFEKLPELAYGPSGAATVRLHFIRRHEDQYEIEGDVTYVDDRFSCAYDTESNSICPNPSCSVSDSHDGTLTGVASYQDGTLTVKPVWRANNYPSETVTTDCGRGTRINNNTSLLQQALQAKNSMIGTTWKIDMANATFIDDLPENEITDQKTASKNFDVTVSPLVHGTGLFGLYRRSPL